MVGPAVDSWSLGCVYTEAATWVVHDYTKLQWFRELRDKETQSIDPNFLDHGCFHSGGDLLKCVKEHLHYLRTTIRKSDESTDGFLDIVEKFMLKPRENERYYGKNLLHEANNIRQGYIIQEEPMSKKRGRNSSIYATFDNKYERKSEGASAQAKNMQTLGNCIPEVLTPEESESERGSAGGDSLRSSLIEHDDMQREPALKEPLEAEGEVSRQPDDECFDRPERRKSLLHQSVESARALAERSHQRYHQFREKMSMPDHHPRPQESVDTLRMPFEVTENGSPSKHQPGHGEQRSREAPRHSMRDSLHRGLEGLGNLAVQSPRNRRHNSQHLRDAHVRYDSRTSTRSITSEREVLPQQGQSSTATQGATPPNSEEPVPYLSLDEVEDWKTQSKRNPAHKRWPFGSHERGPMPKEAILNGLEGRDFVCSMLFHTALHY
jgi:hypothetical protein